MNIFVNEKLWTDILKCQISNEKQITKAICWCKLNKFWWLREIFSSAFGTKLIGNNGRNSITAVRTEWIGFMLCTFQNMNIYSKSCAESETHANLFILKSYRHILYVFTYLVCSWVTPTVQKKAIQLEYFTYIWCVWPLSLES